MAMIRFLLMCALAFAMTMASAQEFVGVPPLQARVTDKVGMLSENQRATLENVLKDYEERTGSQIAVLLISKTEPEAIEQYSIRVAETWKIGRKGMDDGVILVVAKDNPPALRRLRIEAGRGVQGSLTDAQSKRILQDVIAPHFRQNDFYGGLTAGISAIMALLDKEQLPAPDRRAAAQESAEEAGIPFGMILFFFVLFLMMSRAKSSRRRAHRHGWGRAAPGIILGGGWGSGGFGHGGFGHGGFGRGGGFGGGGGFSGGGGTFDGGGASGNW